MRERWKYQIKTGTTWALLTLAIMMLFDWKEHPILPQFSSPKFYLKILVYLITGVFIMGYIFWKGKDPKNNEWSTFIGKKKK